MNVFVKSAVGICATLVAVALSQGVARGSDPVGVYAIIDKVVFEPNADAPERIQLFGVFAVAEPNDRNNYQAPQRGYLYFTLPSGKESVARKEWADLKQMSGKGQVVAFGSRFELRAHVRKTDEKAASPDLYQLSFGLVKVRSDASYPPVRSLLEFEKH
jgi:hypothetical protein